MSRLCLSFPCKAEFDAEADWHRRVWLAAGTAEVYISAGRFGARLPSLRPCAAAGFRSKRPVKFTAFRSMSFSPGNAISIDTESTVCARRDIRSIAIPTNALPALAIRQCEAKAGLGRRPLMPVLFWICRDEEEERWLVIAEGQPLRGISQRRIGRFSTRSISQPMLGSAATQPRSGIGPQGRGCTDQFLKPRRRARCRRCGLARPIATGCFLHRQITPSRIARPCAAEVPSSISGFIIARHDVSRLRRNHPGDLAGTEAVGTDQSVLGRGGTLPVGRPAAFRQLADGRPGWQD